MKLKLLNSRILIINTRKLIPREFKKVRENKITTKNNPVSRKKRKVYEIQKQEKVIRENTRNTEKIINLYKGNCIQYFSFAKKSMDFSSMLVLCQ